MIKPFVLSLGIVSIGMCTALATSQPPLSDQLVQQGHKLLIGPYTSLPEVTMQCLTCHPGQGENILRSSHWTWKRTRTYNGQEKVFSKKNGLTTFALAAGANPAQCLTCHISGNLLDERFDPTSAANIDCLVCHDTTGSYRKTGGKVDQNVNLIYVARNVGKPSSDNCMTCHGTGNEITGIKIHGGIERDIHLQPEGASMSCQQCHPSGGSHSFTRLLASTPGYNQTKGCAVCHSETPHRQQQLNTHAEIISCKTCHIPQYGIDDPAVFSWNWLSAGTIPLFQYSGDSSSRLVVDSGLLQAKRIQPVYLWDNGTDKLYERGAKARKNEVTILQQPASRSAQSKIAPFTATYGTQLIDSKYRYLISPALSDNGMMKFKGNDWNDAARDGMAKLRLPFSGEAVFTSTLAYRRLNHGVAKADQALDCMDCHGRLNRVNWQQLGYAMDPWQDKTPAQMPALSEPATQEEDSPISLPPIRETVLPVVPSN